MSDLLLQLGVSNFCICTLLATVAWLVQGRVKRPDVAHLLWLLVLVKLVTPPILTVPLIEIPAPSSADVGSYPQVLEPIRTPGDALGRDGTALAPAAEAAGAPLIPAQGPSSLELAKTGAAWLWVLGSVGVLAWSLLRILRFNRLLGWASEVAPAHLQAVASELARGLALASTPVIYTTTAQLPPLVWWIGGRRVRVFIPARLVDTMTPDELYWIVAHELAHVRRRDHWVRGLEWLATVCFWWNPVVWWARRQLRTHEELCCDALVLSSLQPDPRAYGSSLLTAIEHLASPALRPPALASAMNSGGFLERRFKMIVSFNRPTKSSRWLRAGILLLAVALLPLSVAYAQAPDHDAVAKRLIASVEAGELTAAQAEAMMAELARARFVELLQAARHHRADPKREYQAIEAKIRAAVEAGQMSKEEARKKLEAIREKMFAGALREAQDDQRKAKYRALEAEIRAAVEAGELSGEEAREKLERIKKELFGERHGDAGTGSGIREALEALGLDAETVDGVFAALKESGLSKDQLEPAVGAMLRIIYGMREAGEDFALDPRLRAYLVGEQKLSDEQMQRVLALARRMAFSRERDAANRHLESLFEALGSEAEQFRGALLDAGVAAEQVDDVLGVLLRVAYEMHTEGDQFELDPRLRHYLVEEMELTEEQIDAVLGMARRAASGIQDD